jgi:AraC-like DNA-binding protein
MKALLKELVDLTRTAGTRPAETGIPRVLMIKGEVPKQQLSALYQPMIGFVVQGEKLLLIGGRDIRMKGPSYFLLPTHVPASGRVRPSREGLPYLSVGLMLDPQILHDLLRDLPPDEVPGCASQFSPIPADLEFVDAWVRLLRLRKTPGDIPALSPVYEREILFRVLRGPQGGVLRQFGLRGSGLSRVAKTVQWLREHYANPVEIGAIAERACMGVTTFHRQFKRATGLSPIQYQKRLRLLEARSLIAFEDYSVANAAYEVGYESASQFNREYSRFFGAPPARDAAELRRLEGTGKDSPRRRPL